MKRVAVIGAGHVGLVSGACFAELGHEVACVDADAARIATLVAGGAPFHEPGLPELLARNVHAGRLHFTRDLAGSVRDAEIVFVAVDTPAGADGRPDVTAVDEVVRSIGAALAPDALVVLKSTIPIEALATFASALPDAEVASNPEFLREGSAIADFLEPERIVFGVASERAAALLRECYAGIDAPVVVTDLRTAETIKYAANAFLATKISFINEIANICDRIGVDVADVASGIGLDSRIGTRWLQPGLGYGGSCLPKDVPALVALAAGHGYEAALLGAVARVNERQVERVFGALVEELDGSVAGAIVAVLGLAFKPGTDDVRNAPALALIEQLLAGGATVRAHDPVALHATPPAIASRIARYENVEDALRGADALLLATEWPEYARLDGPALRGLLRGSLVVDGRNFLAAESIAAAGLRYVGVGRRRDPPARVVERPA